MSCENCEDAKICAERASEELLGGITVIISYADGDISMEVTATGMAGMEEADSMRQAAVIYMIEAAHLMAHRPPDKTAPLGHA